MASGYSWPKEELLQNLGDGREAAAITLRTSSWLDAVTDEEVPVGPTYPGSPVL